MLWWDRFSLVHPSDIHQLRCVIQLFTVFAMLLSAAAPSAASWMVCIDLVHGTVQVQPLWAVVNQDDCHHVCHDDEEAHDHDGELHAHDHADHAPSGTCGDSHCLDLAIHGCDNAAPTGAAPCPDCPVSIARTPIAWSSPCLAAVTDRRPRPRLLRPPDPELLGTVVIQV